MENYYGPVEFLPVLGETASSERIEGEELRQQHLRLGWIKQEGKLAEAVLAGGGEEFSLEKTAELEAAVENGKLARKDLILENLGLAKRFANVARRGSCSAEDLFQVAALALVDVVDAYDPRYGVTVSEYGGKQIRREVSKYISENGFTIGISVTTSTFAVDALRAKYSDHPDFARTLLARKYPKRNLESEADLDRYVDHFRRKGIFAAPIELDQDVVRTVEGEQIDQGCRVVDTWSSHAYAEPGDTDIFSLLGKLDFRDRQVVYMQAIEGMAGAEIGKIFGVSSARVSQIYTRSIKQLRKMLQDDPEMPQQPDRTN